MHINPQASFWACQYYPDHLCLPCTEAPTQLTDYSPNPYGLPPPRFQPHPPTTHSHPFTLSTPNTTALITAASAAPFLDLLDLSIICPAGIALVYV